MRHAQHLSNFNSRVPKGITSVATWQTIGDFFRAILRVSLCLDALGNSDLGAHHPRRAVPDFMGQLGAASRVLRALDHPAV